MLKFLLYPVFFIIPTIAIASVSDLTTQKQRKLMNEIRNHKGLSKSEVILQSQKIFKTRSRKKRRKLQSALSKDCESMKRFSDKFSILLLLFKNQLRSNQIRLSYARTRSSYLRKKFIVRLIKTNISLHTGMQRDYLKAQAFCYAALRKYPVKLTSVRFDSSQVYLSARNWYGSHKRWLKGKLKSSLVFASIKKMIFLDRNGRNRGLFVF
jgi:hypothetical protein